MKKTVIKVGLAVLLVAAFVAWRIGACYVANSELQSYMKDLAVQNGARIGLLTFDTEDELRDKIIARAKGYGIQLAPERVRVRRDLSPKWLDVSLAADYDARVNLLVFSYPIHFSPASSHSAEIIVK
ncbi:MAG: hypothetical protein WB780_09495 [Candidatus Acidiferrales bacterium]